MKLREAAKENTKREAETLIRQLKPGQFIAHNKLDITVYVMDAQEQVIRHSNVAVFNAVVSHYPDKIEYAHWLSDITRDVYMVPLKQARRKTTCQRCSKK